MKTKKMYFKPYVRTAELLENAKLMAGSPAGGIGGNIHDVEEDEALSKRHDDNNDNFWKTEW